MRYFRSSNSPNTLVAIFLLVLLAIFAGPGMLPALFSSIVPGADESIPCSWLRTGVDRAEHQSLIGRSLTNAIAIKVKPLPLPQTPSDKFDLAITLTNRTIGSVAIYFNHDPRSQTLVGDDGQTSGIGLVFNAQGSVAAGNATGGSYPEEDIRLLGPRQSCVYHATFAFEQVSSLGLGPGNNEVKAYYRNTSRGTVQLTAGATSLIYPDQGLWVGVAESDSVAIPVAGS